MELLGLERLADGMGVIGTGIVKDENLGDFGYHFGRNAAERFPQRALGVVGDDEDTDFGRTHIAERSALRHVHIKPECPGIHDADLLSSYRARAGILVQAKIGLKYGTFLNDLA